MIRRPRSLLQHPVVRTLLFERFLLTGSAALAAAAVALGRVRLSEIPRLMDARILTLFFVLTGGRRAGQGIRPLRPPGRVRRALRRDGRRLRKPARLGRQPDRGPDLRPRGGRPRFFWKPFCAVSGVLLVLLVLFALALLTILR